MSSTQHFSNIYRFKNISSGSGLKPLLIVLKSTVKQFWFKTVANEGIISNDSSFESLLIYGPTTVQYEPLLRIHIL
jgi:hypothetical protein